MTNCEIKLMPLPTVIDTTGLELRVGPPLLTVEKLRALEAEARSQGKILFLDEFFNGAPLLK